MIVPKYKCYSQKRKDRIKKVRTVFESIVLLLLLYIIFKSLFNTKSYHPYSGNLSQSSDTGFISISYSGVDRVGSRSLISTARLSEQLKALYDLGYKTISQQDIIDYYKKGKPLPPKALFLIFEDGRRDTAVFSQSVLEEYNFMATVQSYSVNLSKKDSKYLRSEILKTLTDTTFWELGTNGHRLTYINVFDKNGGFLDVLTHDMFYERSADIERRYNHYLMDFIRDKDGIPKETLEEMRQRIVKEYEYMEQAYSAKGGSLPRMYILMHSNSGGFGTNDKSSQINYEMITKMFDINFNREGVCLNTNESSIYDLTRIQIAPHWYTNHLLKRIDDETNTVSKFMIGDLKRSSDWELFRGAAEFIDEKIVVTSVPRADGLICFNKGEYQDIQINTTLEGNIIGTQAIYLRADDAFEQYITVKIADNVLLVSEKSADDDFAKELFSKDLGNNTKDTSNYKLSDAGKKDINIMLVGNEITVIVDGSPAVKNLNVNISGYGYVLLQSECSMDYIKEHIVNDDVYDGVFSDFVIRALASEYKKEGESIYENCVTGLELILMRVNKLWGAVLNWFINSL